MRAGSSVFLGLDLEQPRFFGRRTTGCVCFGGSLFVVSKGNQKDNQLFGGSKEDTPYSCFKSKVTGS